uniref:Methyltransferase FkbM domain-containing protein n=1 Tax=Romanomermis culicivorax TaxID=13658 RepID=A0A915J922_ROMCU
MSSASKAGQYLKLANPIGFNVPEWEDTCTGIGGDFEAEKKVKNYFPNCTFIGADPSYQSGKPFQDIGQFINVAVTDKNGTVTSLVLENSTYVNKQVRSIDFYTMLQYTNTTDIDFFFLDIEGGEYSIIPLLSKKYLKNYHLCQLSMEIHGFNNGEYGMTHEKFTKQIFDLLNESSYLPIFGQYVQNGGFNRMFWVDYESNFCVEKYFHDYCLYVSS